MKKLLVAINSKYIHTNPAVRSLHANCIDDNVEWTEFSVNEQVDDILRSIYKYGADVVCFSCYIWNIEYVMKISSSLRAVASGTIIVFGGPEVSYNPEEYLTDGFADAVMCGEGEITFRELCKNNFDFSVTDGVAYIKDGNIVRNPMRNAINLDELEFPYSEEELKNGNRMFYYETSRGCPYGCSYCLSSADKGLRFKSFEKVCSELMQFINNGVRLVKLTDRTFNADAERAKKIVRFLNENGRETSFHFEIAAHTLDDELIELFMNAEKDRFQLEIGVQTTNRETLNAINRVTDFSKIADNVIRLGKNNNIKLHLDLIAGLPYENMESFRSSFNDVYTLKPHELQLGFLKMLKGTQIRSCSEEHGYRFESYPPYEVISNNYINYDELCELKGISDMLEKYHNSGVFEYSIEYLESEADSYYEVYLSLYRYFVGRNIYGLSVSRDTLYVMLYEYGIENKIGAAFSDCIKFDYLLNNKAQRLPYGCELVDKEFFKNRFEFIDTNRSKYFSQYGDMTAKEIAKRVTFADFEYDVSNGYKKQKTLAMFYREGGYKLK